MVIVEARLKLNRVSHSFFHALHIHVHGSRSKREHIDEMLLGPGLNIKG